MFRLTGDETFIAILDITRNAFIYRDKATCDSSRLSPSTCFSSRQEQISSWFPRVFSARCFAAKFSRSFEIFGYLNKN